MTELLPESTPAVEHEQTFSQPFTASQHSVYNHTVAQLVEQSSMNPRLRGLTPLSFWPHAAVSLEGTLKTCRNASIYVFSLV